MQRQRHARATRRVARSQFYRRSHMRTCAAHAQAAHETAANGGRCGARGVHGAKKG
eukprot:IDg9920t1